MAATWSQAVVPVHACQASTLAQQAVQHPVHKHLSRCLPQLVCSRRQVQTEPSLPKTRSPAVQHGPPWTGAGQPGQQRIHAWRPELHMCTWHRKLHFTHVAIAVVHAYAHAHKLGHHMTANVTTARSNAPGRSRVSLQTAHMVQVVTFVLKTA